MDIHARRGGTRLCLYNTKCDQQSCFSRVERHKDDRSTLDAFTRVFASSNGSSIFLSDVVVRCPQVFWTQERAQRWLLSTKSEGRNIRHGQLTTRAIHGLGEDVQCVANTDRHETTHHGRHKGEQICVEETHGYACDFLGRVPHAYPRCVFPVSLRWSKRARSGRI